MNVYKGYFLYLKDKGITDLIEHQFVRMHKDNWKISGLSVC